MRPSPTECIGSTDFQMFFQPARHCGTLPTGKVNAERQADCGFSHARQV